NFPLNLVAHKIAPALAAGCAVVLKPASQTPLSALLLAELEHDAGLPPGWLNVLVGPSAEIGDVLVEDERVRLITFTGSSGGGEVEDGLLRPTVIAGAGPDLKVSCEEVFGPVCTVNAYDSLDEAIALANGTRYGLQAGVFTADIRAALRAGRELEFGGVTINE